MRPMRSNTPQRIWTTIERRPRRSPKRESPNLQGDESQQRYPIDQHWPSSRGVSMQTKMTEMFGLDAPIFAFSHCRDVVVEATRAGGMGVLGTTRLDPEQLEQELRWIDGHTNGRPYGLDLALPNKMEKVRSMADRDVVLPKEHVQFVDALLEKAGIPRLPADEYDSLHNQSPGFRLTAEGGMELVEVALTHPQIKLVVSALGVA